ncbi:MAG: glycosyltransferase family 2 protein [Candidatus Woesearchaeota archaeon]
MNLTIGIVNWNTGNLLDKCLKSVFDSKTDYSYQVNVVDNNSDDDSLQIIKRDKRIKCLLNKDNNGMAASLNQIIKSTESEFLLFLHPDTEISPDTIQKMIDFMKRNPDISVCGPRLIYPNGQIFLSCHRFPTLIALLKESIGLNGVYMRKADYSKIQSVDIIASACLFIRRNTLLKTGLLDERFTNWMAEWDLCYRIKKLKNGKIIYAPISKVIHYEGMSDTTLKYKKHSFHIADLMTASLLLFYKKHYSKFELYLLKIFTFSNFGLKYVRWCYDSERRIGYSRGIKTIIS